MLGREEFMSGKINGSFKKIYCNRERSNGVIPKTRECSQEKGLFPVKYEKEHHAFVPMQVIEWIIKKLRCRRVRRKNCWSNVFESVRGHDIWCTTQMYPVFQTQSTRRIMVPFTELRYIRGKASLERKNINSPLYVL